MFKASIILLALASTLAAQGKLPVIRSNANTIDLYIEGKSERLLLRQPERTNLVNIDVPDGTRRKVTYKTDVDSIVFNLEVGKTIDFIIEKGGVSYPQRLVGHRINPAALKLKRFLIGSESDPKPKLSGPVLNLHGGGGNVAEALQSTIDRVRGCTDCAAKVDVVVISTSTFDTSNPFSSSIAREGAQKREATPYQKAFASLNGVDSIEMFYFTDPADANTDEAERAITAAEVVFFSGGRQCDYIKAFRGTRVQRAVEAVYKRGGGIGGGSAGQAIMGEFVFDGCNITTGPVTSAIALADPYDKNISFSYNFFPWHFLEDTITDQHLVKRDRIGRTFSFIARQIKDGKAKRVRAVAVDERTSVVMDQKGMATVVGKSNAYFIMGDHQPEVCEPGKPLTYSNFKVWKVMPGGTFDLRKWPTTGYYNVSVDQGKLSRNPY